MSEPFSVLMSVYVKEKAEYLDQAMASIWDQQSLQPDQIVLVEDGPLTPELSECIDGWSSKIGSRLDVVKLEVNQGLGVALNIGLSHCRYDLVARMDSDDVSLPDRFARQVHFMCNSPELAASSARIEECSQDLNEVISIRNVPQDSMAIRRFSRLRCPLSHPVTVYRKSAVEKVGGYPHVRGPEDHWLWVKMLNAGYQLGNLPDVLLKMRAGDAVFERRGYQFYRGELKLLKFKWKTGFINMPGYISGVVFKFFIRLSPLFVKRFAYAKVRR